MEEDLYYRRDTTERELAARWGIKGAELEKYSDRPPKFIHIGMEQVKLIFIG